MKTIRELQDWLEKMWESDWTIELEQEGKPSKILILQTEGSYWDHYGDGKWRFYGKRNLEPAYESIYPQYTKFQDKMPENIWGRYFTLEETKELVELVFSGRTTNYTEIERRFG